MRYVSSPQFVATRRQGVVLLVVMAMLTLFAALGIGFVFYADAVAVASQTNRAAMTKQQAYIDPELTAAYFLNQFLYGVDYNKNPYSSLIGHSLAETLWGYNPAMLNYTPFNGPGRQSYPVAAANNMDNFKMVNFAKVDSDGFQRLPGFNTTTNTYIEGTNVPWTAVDEHNMFLGLTQADGTVLAASYVRPWIDPNIRGTDPTTKSWYLTLRPHGSWHPGFVPRSTFGGGFPYLPDSEEITIGTGAASTTLILDVKNSDFGIGFSGTAGPTLKYNNDSIWMDLGFPIMTAPDGRRFRPLFAPLVVDLSSRLHLWAHGNNIGAGSHVSSLGFGAPEVNLGRVIPAADLPKLYALRGNPTGTPIGLPAFGPPYAKIDFDALDATTNKSAVPFSLPSGTSYSFCSIFPNFTNPITGNENDPTTEAVLGKPLGRNLFLPAPAGTPPLPMSEMEWLLRYGGTNTPAIPSELARQLTSTFTDAGRRNRNMVTLRSSHLDRIAAAPVISFDPYDPTLKAGRYALTQPDPLTKLWMPVLANSPVPAVSPSSPPAASNNEFTKDWRSNLGNRLRVNLNRKLRSYPDLDAKTGMIVDTATLTYANALFDRQVMARELYNALVGVTGATDPNNSAAATLTWARETPTNPSASYKAARWLAQLAVNIVDYIDEDDYNTPFQWDLGNATAPGEYVFGTEMPRLVINEFYGQYDNDGVTPMAPTCNLNVWLELHNPFATKGGSISTYPRDNGKAELVRNGNPVYQIAVCYSETQSGKTPTTFIRDPGNNLGTPDKAILIATVNDWGPAAATGGAGPTQEVLPSDGIFQTPTTDTNNNTGFYVIGPGGVNFLAGRDPTFKRITYSTSKLSIAVPHPTADDATFGYATVLLQRLANPHMGPNNDATSSTYNPYITVDYIADTLVWDNRAQNATGGAVTSIPVNQMQALGRRQPYAAQPLQPQTAQEWSSTGTQPKHTFFRHNSKSNDPTKVDPNTTQLSFPFDWLTHLDRPLINPTELIHVSGFKPHELTQQFRPTTNGLFQHIAPWYDLPTATTRFAQSAMIYRLLDLVTTPNHLAGTYSGGVHPGLINGNTLTEPEILLAMADANFDASYPMSIRFTDNNVWDSSNPPTGSAFGNLAMSRTANGFAALSTMLQPTANGGKPFKGFAAGNKEDTWLRLAPTPTVKAFDVPSAHPYLQNALLQKIYNNLTTTSNVFAVSWTVGYFEVLDETVRPARLGAEIGRSENRHIRHRFFAIVDRSAMQLYSTAVTTTPPAAGQPITQATITAAINTKTGTAAPWNPTQAYINMNGVIGTDGAPYICIQPNTGQDPTVVPSTFWQRALQPGMIVEMDVGTANAEAVVVKSASGNTFQADFQFPHSGTMFLRGNPGPQPTYNPHRDPNVVLHMNIIK